MAETQAADKRRIIRDPVDASLGQELFRLGPLAQTVSLIAGLILALALSPAVPWPRLGIWYALLALSVGYRAWLIFDHRRQPDDDYHLDRALSRYRLALIGTGAAWGSAALLTWPAFPVAYQAIVGMVLAGIAAGAVTLLSALRGFYLVFIIPALAPAALLFLAGGTVVETAAGVVILFAMASLFRIQRDLHGILRRNVELSEANRRMVEDLGRANRLTERRAAALAALYDSTSHPGRGHADRLRHTLETGRQFFGLPHAALTRAQPGRTTPVCLASRVDIDHPEREALHDASVHYARRQLSGKEPHACDGPSPSMHGNLQSFIGTRVSAGNGFSGYLHFFGDRPRGRDYSDSGREFIRLMANWLAGELARESLRLELEEAVRDLETVADSVPVGIVYLDRDLCFDYCNRQYAALLQRPKDAIEGQRLIDIVGPTTFERTRPYLRRALSGDIVRYEARPESPALSERVFDTRYVPDFGADGAVRGIFAVIVDITEIRLAEQALATEKELALTTLEAMAEGVVRVGVDGVVRYLNPAAAELTGWPAAEAVDRSLHEVLPAWDASGRHAAGPIVRIAGGREERFVPDDDLWLRRPDGSGAWVSLVAQPLHGEGGEVDQVVAILRDRTQARRVMDELSYRAAHDTLTGLPNRGAFEDRVRRAVETARRTGRGFALMMLDLDGFKQVNDTAGHLAGDRLLVRIANALKRQLRREDVVARLGGDEFAVLLTDVDLDSAERVGATLVKAVSKLRVEWRGRRLKVGVSIGLAAVRGDWSVARNIKAADDACYDAKRAGRACVRRTA